MQQIMLVLPTLVLATLLTGAAPPANRTRVNVLPVEVAHTDIEQARRIEIVSQEVSGRESDDLTVIAKPKAEQFSIDFDWEGTHYRHVKILLVGGRQWDAIRYYPKIEHGKPHFFNLLDMRGVSVNAVGNDCSIEFFTSTAASLLPPAGKLIFRFREGAGPRLDSAPIGIKRAPKDQE